MPDNNNMKRCLLLLLFLPFFAYAESLYSSVWGFFIDLPAGYEYVDGNARDKFSFAGPAGVMFDLAVYSGNFGSINELLTETNRRLDNRGSVDFFRYNDKDAAIVELIFRNYRGWALCIDLNKQDKKTLLLALAYGPNETADLDLMHVSALDSICPTVEEKFFPGPIMEYSYPRGNAVGVTLKGGIKTNIRENDAEAAQFLVEREYVICSYYINTNLWQEAWQRYYRLIYRDSWDRILIPVSAITVNMGSSRANTDEAKKLFTQRTLDYVQSFVYERGSVISDFQNLVTTVVQGKGDCDSRVMLWAIMLAQANIRAAMMVSPHYSHAMGLVDIEGAGARFESHGTKWLVAETTDNVDLGLIEQSVSDPKHWLGISFY